MQKHEPLRNVLNGLNSAEFSTHLNSNPNHNKIFAHQLKITFKPIKNQYHCHLIS
jgi:uncharacterized protein VirK/YbjX